MARAPPKACLTCTSMSFRAGAMMTFFNGWLKPALQSPEQTLLSALGRSLCGGHCRAGAVDREPLALVLAELLADVVDHGTNARALVGLLMRHQPDVAHDVELDGGGDDVGGLAAVAREDRQPPRSLHRLHGRVR